jgi:hypothetical protein
MAIADIGWTPGRYGVTISTRDVDGQPSSVSIRHHLNPFKGELEVSGQYFDERSLQNVALHYLSELKQREFIDLPQEWLNALQNGGADVPFGWMPIGWPPEPEHEADINAADPFVSFRVERKTAYGERHDTTIMLLASEKLGGQFIGSGFGIAVVVNVRSPRQGRFEAQIVGLWASLPYGHYKNGISTDADLADFRIGQLALLASLRSDFVKGEIQMIAGLNSASIRSVRISKLDSNDEWEVERYGTAKGHTTAGQPIAYSFAFVGTPMTAGKLVSRVLLQAEAEADADVFPIDPASQGTKAGYRARRPSRSDAELADYLTTAQVPTGPLALQQYDAHGHELMRVVCCPEFVLADAGAAHGTAKSVNLQYGAPAVHSDDFSAISAFYNANQMFDRMIAYDLDPFDYFRFGDLPLKVAYRSGMQAGAGKDGKIINACVEVEGWDFDFVGPTKVGERPKMQMHLALADKSRRGRKRWDWLKRSGAEPLGIAADDRWIWHEFGHVLLVAGVGELEFRFAHSSGDALAAIALDPVSNLVTGDHPDRSYWRGMTFPWVFLPRRHDRCVSNGWSWGGTMHRALSHVPDSTPPRRKAYLSEQILSSSLFRLYRALGGDTAEQTEEDISTRQAASHYCLFLIMDAIRRLGIGPAAQLYNDPGQFVDALLDADIATGEWNVTIPPGSPPYAYRRVGGSAYKVIRWAFEAQGLYTTAGAITNAPGLPPAVDIYIADGRRSETTESGIVTYGPGNYAPVSLYWDANQTGNEPNLPAWQADPNSIRVQADGIYVVVGNRGTEDADNVEVSVSWIEWTDLAVAPPAWNSAGWAPRAAIAVQDIPAGTNVEFGPFQFAPPAHRRYIVVAMATCDDDRATPDAANLACSYLETRLVDLVSGDNNLGLRVVSLP